MESFKEIGFLGGMLALGVWYIKHKITVSSKIQLEKFMEHERNKNRELLESFKTELGLSSEIVKAKHLSIYERRAHALLDSFACVSDCESSMGKIAEDCSTNKGHEFRKLHEKFLTRKDSLLSTFWRNSALFSGALIEEFQRFKRGTLLPYTAVYKSIEKSLNSCGELTENHINQLIALEIEYGKFAKSLKREIRAILHES